MTRETLGDAFTQLGSCVPPEPTDEVITQLAEVQSQFLGRWDSSVNRHEWASIQCREAGCNCSTILGWQCSACGMFRAAGAGPCKQSRYAGHHAVGLTTIVVEDREANTLRVDWVIGCVWCQTAFEPSWLETPVEVCLGNNHK